MKTKSKSSYAPGMLVKYTAKFLQSTGWYTDVPKDGKVTEVDNDMLTIHWCDREAPIRVLACNVMPASKPDYSGL